MTKALYLSGDDVAQETIPGPIIETKLTKDEINLEEPKIVEKPLNPDVNALAKQIDKYKAQNTKPPAEEVRDISPKNGTNLKSALRSSQREREGDEPNGTSKQDHKSTNTQKKELKDNPVEFSKT